MNLVVKTIFCLLISKSLALKILKDNSTVLEKWITQKLDNFNPIDSRTWLSRYLENSQYFQLGGPIFILAGGEWDIKIEDNWLNEGLMHDMAKELNATMFYVEHRYYGQSFPTTDTSTENLRFLNVDQALADLAQFILQIKSKNPELKNSKVILVGRSYSASLVSWFRKRYPHLSIGAWASSGPILAKVEFYELMEIISEAIRRVGGEKCAKRIGKAFSEIGQSVATNDTRSVEKLFNLCDPIDVRNSLDIMNLMTELSDASSEMVQYKGPDYIKWACSVINNESLTDIEGYAAYYRRHREKELCLNFKYKKLVDFYRNHDFSHGANQDCKDYKICLRQWLYQSCSEFGWFATSKSNNQIFENGFPLKLFTSLCVDIFDGVFDAEVIEKNIQITNTRFGGLNPSIKNLITTHGELDPWAVLGPKHDLNKHSPTIIIPGRKFDQGATHCGDFDSISNKDPPQVRATKETIFQTIKTWLGLNEEKSDQ